VKPGSAPHSGRRRNPARPALSRVWPGPGGPGVRGASRAAGEQIFYLPGGTLHCPGNLARSPRLPLKAESFAEICLFARVLYRLGLERLAPLLDTTPVGPGIESGTSKLCLAIHAFAANAALVLIDGTSVRSTTTSSNWSIEFTNELSHTGVIHIGGPGQAHATVHARPDIWSRTLGVETANFALKEPGSHE